MDQSHPKHRPTQQESDRRDLQDALLLANWLEEHETKDRQGYVIQEGYDIYDMMRSVVMLARAYRGLATALQQASPPVPSAPLAPVVVPPPAREPTYLERMTKRPPTT